MNINIDGQSIIDELSKRIGDYAKENAILNLYIKQLEKEIQLLRANQENE